MDSYLYDYHEEKVERTILSVLEGIRITDWNDFFYCHWVKYPCDHFTDYSCTEKLYFLVDNILPFNVFFFFNTSMELLQLSLSLSLVAFAFWIWSSLALRLLPVVSNV